MRLSEFHRDIFVLNRLSATKSNPKTRQSYEETIGWWKKLTGDPELKEITDDICAKFVADLGEQPGKVRGKTVKRSTVNKHCVNLKAMLAMAGPRALHPQGRDLIPFRPFIPCPTVDREAPHKNWSIDQMRAIYAHCDAAKSPTLSGVTPKAWWEGCVVTGYYTGMRVSTLLAFQWDHFEGNWLHLPAEICKQRHGKNIYVHPEALEHLQRIKRDGQRLVITIFR